jgi:hypothetical protein
MEDSIFLTLDNLKSYRVLPPPPSLKIHTSKNENIMSMWSLIRHRFWMTRFIGLFDTGHDYNLDFTVTHTLVSTVTSSLPLFGSSFQLHMFPFLWVPELSLASATSF